MAAPTTPVSPFPGVGFFQDAINTITTLSNMSIPIATDAAQTGVISGTTATLIIAALTLQRGFV